MKVTRQMSIGQLQEHMGPEAIESEARKMREILIERGYEGLSIAEIDNDEWAEMLDACVKPMCAD